MRRLLPLLALAVVGCGGARSGNETYTQVLKGGLLGTTARIATLASGVDLAGRPVLGYTLELGHTVYAATPEGTTSFDVDTESTVAPAFNAGDATVVGAAAKGSYVDDRRAGTGRWVDDVEPAGADGNQVLWLRWDGQVSVEDLSTGVRTDVPLVVRDRTYDQILDFRNGRILFEKDLDPHNLKKVSIAYQVLALDGTVIDTLTVPDGVQIANPTCLSAKGEVGGTVIATAAHLPVRWSTAGVPTLLPTADLPWNQPLWKDVPPKDLRVAGLLEDGRLVVGPNYGRGTMRLLNESGSTNLGIAVNGRQNGHVAGNYLFLDQELPLSAAVYPLP